jgi:hypothetical protein
MKKTGLYLTLMAAGLMIAGNTDAKIWRVNNNPGKSGTFGSVVVFGDLTSALRSLRKGGDGNINKGDTIHIEGSVTPYGKTGQTATLCDTVYKRVVIIGPGYMLSDNSETQHNKESAKVRTLYIAKEAGGTVVAGIEQLRPTIVTTGAADTDLLPTTVGSEYKLATVRVSTTSVNTTVPAALWGDNPNAYKLRIVADSVVVSHSKLYYVDLYNKDRGLTNITVTKCIFNPGLIAVAGEKTVSNLIVSNNFFRNAYDTAPINTNDWYHYPYRYLVLSFFAPGVSNSGNTSLAVYTGLTFPVVSPTIQNNTFYKECNLGVKSGRLYNNIFFYTTNLYYVHGLPVWPGVAEHDARNNIIYNGAGNTSYWGSPTLTFYPAGSEVIYYNCYGGMLNDGNNTYSNVAETSWFSSSTTLPALDKSFVLQSASPARDASNDDTKQRGMYGGLAPYVLSGLYTIPAVWEITIPSYPSGEVPSTGFEVRVKVKSH